MRRQRLENAGGRKKGGPKRQDQEESPEVYEQDYWGDADTYLSRDKGSGAGGRDVFLETLANPGNRLRNTMRAELKGRDGEDYPYRKWAGHRLYAENARVPKETGASCSPNAGGKASWMPVLAGVTCLILLLCSLVLACRCFKKKGVRGKEVKDYICSCGAKSTSSLGHRDFGVLAGPKYDTLPYLVDDAESSPEEPPPEKEKKKRGSRSKKRASKPSAQLDRIHEEPETSTGSSPEVKSEGGSKKSKKMSDLGPVKSS